MRCLECNCAHWDLFKDCCGLSDSDDETFYFFCPCCGSDRRETDEIENKEGGKSDGKCDH